MKDAKKVLDAIDNHIKNDPKLAKDILEILNSSEKDNFLESVKSDIKSSRKGSKIDKNKLSQHKVNYINKTTL